MRRIWDWLDTDEARNVILIALAAPFVAFILSFVFPAFRNVLVLALSPVIGGLAYRARHQRWALPRTWQIALAAAVIAVAGLLFLISPSYLGRML